MNGIPLSSRPLHALPPFTRTLLHDLQRLRSRLFTALNLLPSIATAACKTASGHDSSTKRRHTARMPAPLSRLKSAMVLKFDAKRPVSHINSMLRWHLAPVAGSTARG